VPRWFLILSIAAVGVHAPVALFANQATAPGATVADAPVPGLGPGDVLALQVRLDQAGCSPGEIDGVFGLNTRRAIAAFQRRRGLAVTGEPDHLTLEALATGTAGDVLITHTIAPDDLAGPFTPDIPSQLPEQGNLPLLGYRSPLELLAERYHVAPELLRSLNPGATFAAVGEAVLVPNVVPYVQVGAHVAGGDVTQAPEGATVVVSRSAGSLVVVAADGSERLHAPVSTGSEHDPLPIGEWQVTEVRHNPIYNYNPELFWDADPSHAKVQIQPGPNNPVGVVWMGLTRRHYGLHGTPEPGRVGHAQSHGCVRLTNWDAVRVAALVRKGTRVLFEE
jgi:lipoprotein-anchoring transpeptidase ErfK/SrfK